MAHVPVREFRPWERYRSSNDGPILGADPVDAQRAADSDLVTDKRAIGMNERPTVSIPQACEEVGVSRRTIYNWMATGKVEFVRTAGGSVRIFTETLWRSSDSGRRATLATVIDQAG